jgi:hypothetical protein
MFRNFTNNGHMAGKCPSMSGLWQDQDNNGLQLLLSLPERHNGGRWETLTVDRGQIEIEFVYNMYRVKPAAVSGPS